MEWTGLPTDYQDAAWNGSRKFNMTKNSDGTYSFEDVTEYTQIDHAYRSADDVNQTNAAINMLMEIFQGSYRLPEPTNVIVSNGDTAAFLSWTDPENIVDEHGMIILQWSGTKIVRKANTPPTSENDGVVVLDEKMRNQYSVDAYLDSGLVNGTVYYYGFFPYATNNNYTTSYIEEFIPSAISLREPVINSVVYNDGVMTINFTNNNDSGDLRLVYKESSAPTTPTDGSIKRISEGASVSVTGLKPNKDYFFVLYVSTASTTVKSNIEIGSTFTGEKVSVTISASNPGLLSNNELEVRIEDITDDSFNKSIIINDFGTYKFGTIPTGHAYKVVIPSVGVFKSYASDNYTAGSSAVTKTATLATVTFTEATWEQVSYAGNNHIASLIWHIGDTKTITITGNNYTIMIGDFNKVHLYNNPNETAEMVLSWKNCYMYGKISGTSLSNPKGWEEFAIRESFAATAIEMERMGIDLKEVRVPYKDADNLNIQKYSKDKLFLPSCSNIGRECKFVRSYKLIYRESGNPTITDSSYDTVSDGTRFDGIGYYSYDQGYAPDGDYRIALRDIYPQTCTRVNEVNQTTETIKSYPLASLIYVDKIYTFEPRIAYGYIVQEKEYGYASNINPLFCV